ncbi:hypothetical protein [Hyphomonas sp.]|uniref:hypothetical protein n=1 Tax=Hyphomonas sp. TaxID=87 RepID=UPI003299F708
MMNTGSSVSLPLRLWFGAEVFFGLAAILSITIAPQDTASNFAWTIKPTVTAAILGAFYASVAPIFVLAMVARRWEMVRVIIWPAIVFTSVELAATWIHWDKFRVDSGSFMLWYASYLLPPPIFLALFLYQVRRQVTLPALEPMGKTLRLTLCALGCLFTLEGLYSFVRPEHFTANHAFEVTVLTARATAGWIVALGLMMVSMAWEGARERARIGSPFLILPLPLLFLQMSRFADEVDWSHPRLIAAFALFAATSLLGLWLAKGNWRSSLS